jgi:glutamate dehydrogenase (NADP+)
MITVGVDSYITLEYAESYMATASEEVRAAREAAKEFNDPDNYVMGANIAGFRKVADAMIDLGI